MTKGGEGSIGVWLGQGEGVAVQERTPTCPVDVPTARVKASLYLRAVTAGITLVMKPWGWPGKEEQEKKKKRRMR